jgi:CHAD domain-containing protein
MAYRLEREETVSAGLKRVIREQIESAVDRLSDKKTTRDEAIHSSRKSIKKVRATLRLARKDIGESQVEHARLRDIASRISEFRDAFVIIATFDELKKKYRDEAGGAKLGTKLRSIRAGLARRRREAGSEEDTGPVVKAAAEALRRTSKRLAKWHLKSEGFAAIGPGLEETYRAGRRALAAARKDGNAEKLHQLRKRVKDHWYHVRLLEGLWAEMMDAYEKSLRDLETWLGDDHNLTVLRDKIAAEPAFYGNERDVALAFDLISRYQKELREKALPLAERIYEEKPREFMHRMKRLWNIWQGEV